MDDDDTKADGGARMDNDTGMALLIEAALEDRLTHDGASTMASTFRRRIEVLEATLDQVRREKTALAERVDGAVARADLLRDIARHERDVYAHVIARLRDALRLDAGASLGDVVKRAEELAALRAGAQ